MYHTTSLQQPFPLCLEQNHTSGICVLPPAILPRLSFHWSFCICHVPVSYAVQTFHYRHPSWNGWHSHIPRPVLLLVVICQVLYRLLSGISWQFHQINYSPLTNSLLYSLFLFSNTFNFIFTLTERHKTHQISPPVNLNQFKFGISCLIHRPIPNAENRPWDQVRTQYLYLEYMPFKHSLP